VIDGLLTWQPDPAVPALEIDLREYFAKVWGKGEVSSEK
jgi:hypothetical protein